MGGVISVTISKPDKTVISGADSDGKPNRGGEEVPQNSSFDLTESIVEKRAGPGILILSTATQLLYKDRRAWEMCAGINRSVGKTANGVLPAAIVELCGEINKLLQIWTDAKDWEQIRIKRVIGNPDRPILLCGLGLPDRHSLQQSRILITMEEIGRRQGAILDQVKELFRLTDREVTVVQNLLKGWTNKEIANELGVTEQTVKEHIKHIMAKTKTSTRTGILVQVLRL
jgi:DNA-binding CsgD family transcriptional regulator